MKMIFIMKDGLVGNPQDGDMLNRRKTRLVGNFEWRLVSHAHACGGKEEGKRLDSLTKVSSQRTSECSLFRQKKLGEERQIFLWLGHFVCEVS